MSAAPIVCPSCSATATPDAVICAKCGTLLTDEVESAEATALLANLARALEGRYVIGEVLGSGRGGITVRAHHTTSKRDVAIKVAWDDSNARTRALRETVLTAKVAHPAVLAVRDIPAPEPMLVVEMQLASGGTLSDVLSAGKPVPFPAVLEIVRAIGGALDQAHAAGIIHGGLRPIKILLDSDGKPLLSDFAIRIPRRADWDVSRPSEVGAQAYMPLEQRHDSESLDGRTDQYALAIIAYELLRGHATWRVNGEGVLEVDAVEIIVHRPIAPDAPLSASMAVKRATAKDPTFRYPSVGAFARAFSGESADVVAKEHIHRDEEAPKQRHSKAWMVAPVALGLALLLIRPEVRDTAMDWWDNTVLIDRSGETRRSTNSSNSTPPGGSSPASPTNPRTGRAEPARSPSNTRVGEQASTIRQSSRDGTPDPAPRLNPTTTRETTPSSRESNTRRPLDIPPPLAPVTRASSGDSPGAARPIIAGGEITRRQRVTPPGATPPGDSTGQVGEGTIVVTLNADARAIVMVDGRPRGQTPLTLKVPSGSHVVSLRGTDSYSPVTKTITLSAGDTSRATFTLRGNP